MRMIKVLAIFCLTLGTGWILANDEIVLKGGKGKQKSPIKSENPKEIILKSGQTVQADEIEDIYYEITEKTAKSHVTTNITYRNAILAEKDSYDPKKAAKRRDHINDAITKYRTVQGNVTDKFIKRHVDYKVGFLQARLVLEEGDKNVKPAIDNLAKFVETHQNGWQFTRAAFLLAKLQLDQLDFAGADKTFQMIASSPDVADTIKNEAELNSIVYSIKASKDSVKALPRLDNLIKKLPADSPLLGKAKVYKADALITSKQTEEGMKVLKGITKDPNLEPDLKAFAYNTLGKYYVEKGQFKDARWEFLWVDVVYNQDKNEHAKALYYLNQVFTQLGDLERAQECREILLTDNRLLGTEYQRIAARDFKK